MLQACGYQCQAAVYAGHGGQDVCWEVGEEERAEEREGLDFGAGGIEERRAKDVETLDVG